MAIRIITGKPGGGKSFFSLGEVVEELVFGCRVVVTNLPLKLPELNAYLQRQYPKADVDLHDRVRILSDEETSFFFAHRAQGCDFTIPSEEQTKRGVRIDYGDISKLRPVFYVIDEAHIKFDARAWMTSGPHLTYYNSQHRKPGDEVFFVTQFVALLDKRCTGFAQEFIECRNFGMERLSVFRGPKGQHQARYTLTPPGTGGPAVHQALFRLDVALAACYDTTSGVGISGRSGAPREKQVKGLSPGYAVFAVGGVIAVLWWAPDALTRLMVRGTGHVAQVASGSIDRLQPPATTVAHSTTTPSHLVMTWYWLESSARGPVVHVILADGREIPPAELESWDFRTPGFESVRWRGQMVEMETPAARRMRKAGRQSGDASGLSSSLQGLAPRSVEPEAKTRS